MDETNPNMSDLSATVVGDWLRTSGNSTPVKVTRVTKAQVFTEARQTILDKPYEIAWWRKDGRQVGMTGGWGCTPCANRIPAKEAQHLLRLLGQGAVRSGHVGRAQKPGAQRHRVLRRHQDCASPWPPRLRSRGTPAMSKATPIIVYESPRHVQHRTRTYEFRGEFVTKRLQLGRGRVRYILPVLSYPEGGMLPKHQAITRPEAARVLRGLRRHYTPSARKRYQPQP